MKILTLFIFIFLIISCTTSIKESKKENNNHIDSIAKIRLNSCDTALVDNQMKVVEENEILENFDSIVFSKSFLLPIFEMYDSPFNKGRLLIRTNGSNYEINKDFTGLRNLSSFLGKVGNEIREENIVKDQFNDSLIWAIGFHHGLVRYNVFNKEIRELSSKDFFKRSALSCISISKDYVWVGTSEGFFRIRKSDFSVDSISDFNGIWIKSIVKSDNGKLVVNSNYLFDEESHSIVPFNKVKGVKYDIITNYRLIDNAIVFTYQENKKKVIFPNDLIKDFNYNRPSYNSFLYDGKLWDLNGSISYFDYSNDSTVSIKFENYPKTFCVDDSLIWFTSENLIFKLEMKTEKIFRCPKPFNNISSLHVDDNYLFINYRNRLMRLRKEQLFKSLILNSSICNDEILFKKLVHEIEMNYSENPIEILNSYLKVKKRFNNSTNTIINNKLKILEKNTISYLIHQMSDETFKVLLENLQAGKYDLVKDVIYYGITIKYGVDRDIANAQKYYQILKNEYPQSRFIKVFGKNDSICFDRIKRELTLINDSNLTTDIKLWHKYNCFDKNVLSDVFSLGWLSRPYCYFYLDTIIQSYPESEYADNAEWIIQEYNNCFRNEEGDPEHFSDHDLNFSRSFLSKYQDSEFIPEVLMDMAYIYTYCGDSLLERLRYIDTALIVYEKLIEEYPEFARKNNIEKKLNIKNNLLKHGLGWKFSFNSKKMTYSRTEPIELEFKIKNEANFSRELEVYENIPNFYVGLYGETEFVELLNKPIGIKKVVKIPAFGTYCEVWDIKSMIKNNRYSPPGYYKIGDVERITIRGGQGVFDYESESMKELRLNIIDE